MRTLVFLSLTATLAIADPAPWADNPALKRAFLAGYGVNSAIEPTLSENDQKVLELLQSVIEKSREDAIKSLEKYADATTNARFDLILANLYLEARKMPQAIKAFNAAIEKFPNFRAAHKNLGLAYFQEQQPDRAIAHFARAVQLGEADAAMFGAMGQCHLTLGDGVAAETAFRYAAMLQPAVMEWRKGNIAALIRQGRIQDAIAQVDGLIAQDPENPEWLRQQSQLYTAAGDFLKSAELLELLALQGEANAEDLLQLGDIYVNQKIPGPAVRSYAGALQLGADPERAVKAAEVLGSTGALDEAEALVATVRAALGPEAVTATKNRLLRISARIATAKKADDQAAAILKEITDADPLDGDAWMLLGKYYQKKEEIERAIFAYERAAALEEFKADANIRLAQIHVGRQEFAKAIPLLEESQRIKPRDNIARYLDQVKLLAKSRG